MASLRRTPPRWAVSTSPRCRPPDEASRGAHSHQEVASAFFLWLRGPGFPRLSHASSVPAGKGRKETAPVWQSGLMGATRMGLAWLRSVGRASFLGEAPGKSPCDVRLCCAGLEFWPLHLACFVGMSGGAADTPCLPPLPWVPHCLVYCLAGAPLVQLPLSSASRPGLARSLCGRRARQGGEQTQHPTLTTPRGSGRPHVNFGRWTWMHLSVRDTSR